VITVTELQEQLADVTKGRPAIPRLAQEGAQAGPGDRLGPGCPQPQDYDRGYTDEGHGAPSPVAEPARQDPKPVQEPGRVQPIAMPGAPYPVAHVALPGNAVASPVPVHITQSLSMGSPSER
jgi:hypothetical protein